MSLERVVVLITGVGAPGIRGTLYALGKVSEIQPIRTVGVDIRTDVVGRYLVERFHAVPPPEEPDYVDTLMEVCHKENVRVVIPQTTREAAVLSQHRKDFLGQGIGVMVSDATAMEVANDKYRLLQLFERLELPHPAYTLARSEEELIGGAHSLGYPSRAVVVKPPVSNGMRGLRVLREAAWDANRFLQEKPSGVEISLEDLLRILRRGSDWPVLLVTEYLPGPEYSVDAFIGEKIQVAIPRLRKSTRSGITFESILDFDEDMARFTLRSGERMGLRYVFGFQFKRDETGTPKVLECNPRVQGTMVASLFSGVNVIGMALREILGAPPTELPQSLKGATFYRFWGGVGVLEGRSNEI
jgi:carbamoyl-phosphate synthase large subunit